jgi:hypothetical protein
VTIPNEFWEAVTKIVHETEADGGELFISKEWAKAAINNGYTIYGRLLTIDNPVDHGKLIEDTLKSEPQYFKISDELPAALSRARVLADQESAKTTLTVEKGRLKLLTDTHNGMVRDSLAIADVPDVQADVSAELLHRIVTQCDAMAIMENCTVFRKSGTKLFQLVSNLGS